MELMPTVCNLCHGKVIYTSNANIYGREYGSGKMYFCTNCYAYVGTHEPRPKEALGILADEPMRAMKVKCHELFDRSWKSKTGYEQKKRARKRAYQRLARQLGIDKEECHFGYFDLEMLNKAYRILCDW